MPGGASVSSMISPRSSPPEIALLIPPPLLTRADALFLDFDGTLASIQDDPETVWLPEGGALRLMRVSRFLEGRLVIISGRDIRDLSRRVPTGLWRAGGHGLNVLAPDDPVPDEMPGAPETLLTALRELPDRHPGVRIEEKGALVAIHYRQAPQLREPLHKALEDICADHPEYRLQAGKMVFELKPVGAHKGDALYRLMQQTPFTGLRPIMVGDDATDEDAMDAAIGLGGAGVRVGAGETTAQYRLEDPACVWAWLERSLA